jgi:F-type H+-transporting ATPase subunit b
MEHKSESLLADPRFWVGVAFILFFVIFGRKLWSIVTAALDSRATQVRAELDAAARLRVEAEALLADAKERRAAALREAEAMLAQARDEAVRVAEAARAEAAASATRRERMAMERISAAEKAAIFEVRLAAADVAAKAASQVIAESFGQDSDAHLIDHAIQGLPSALGGRRAA